MNYLYLVGAVYPWRSFTVDGERLRAPDIPGCIGLALAFESEAAAMDYAGEKFAISRMLKTPIEYTEQAARAGTETPDASLDPNPVTED